MKQYYVYIMTNRSKTLYIGVTNNLQRNMSSSNQGYTYGFVIRFVDSGHFKAYAPHPAHQPVSEELQRICQKIIDFDIA